MVSQMLHVMTNGHISATHRPIDFVFRSGVGFSRTADRMAPFPVGPNSKWKSSNGHISATRRPIHFSFGSSVGFSGTANQTAPFFVGPNSRRRRAAILKIISGHDSQQGDVRDIFARYSIYPNVCDLVSQCRLCITHAVNISNNLNTLHTRLEWQLCIYL